MRQIPHSVRAGVVVLVTAAALWLLYREVREFELEQVLAGLRAIPVANIWLAGGLTIVSYAILIGYDWVAVRSIGSRLPIRRILLASFCGHAISYSFGALLGGGSVRYRLYALWGLSTIQIMQLLAILGITFWIGACGLAGIMFLVDPMDIPAGVPIPFDNVLPIGWILLAIVAGYLILTGVRQRPFTLRGHQVSLPTLRYSVLQLVIASLDLLVGGTVLYVLRPPTLDVEYIRFISVYLLGVVAVLFTHVPGGVGVLELVILSVAPPDQKQALFSSLLIFRVIYYVCPVLIAFVLLLGHEIRLLLRHIRHKPTGTDQSIFKKPLGTATHDS